jgi:hypothetical protein
MTLRVIDRAPQARCYECGSTDVRSVCHHCARPMCARHGSLAVGEGADGSPGTDTGGAGREPGAADGMAPNGADARPASREFAGLKLTPIRAAVHHCADHDHVVGLLSTGISFASSVMGRQTPAHELPPLPVFPDVNRVSVTERLTGEVRLTDAGYVSMPQPVEGEIVIGMTHARARWQETMTRYRKWHHLPEDYPMRFAAGVAMLRGKAGLVFDAGHDAILADGLGLAFHGDVDGHDLFDAKRGRPQGEWDLSVRYKLQAECAPQDIPLWIVPSLGATSDKRVLMVDVHWNMPETDGVRAELSQFELIEFQVPHQWGNLLDSEPSGATISAPEAGQPRIVRWRQYRPGADDRGPGSGHGSVPRSMTLKMEFEKSILEQPRMSGALRATFNRSLSGVTGIDFYLPGGGPVRHLDVKPRTDVSVRFDISLGALRYQERRTVPDQTKADGEDRLRAEPDTFLGVMPDYRTVVELTNAISADGYYVKTVVEDHPNRDAREKTFKRGWDITGRWYEGVFPINFTISLRGTEPQDVVTGPVRARTVAAITVDGTFPNAEMKRRIEDKWDGLHARVTGLLAARAVSTALPPAGVTHGLITGRPAEIAAPSTPTLTIPPLSVVSPAHGVPARHGSDDDSGSTIVAGAIVSRGDPAALGDEAGLAAELQRQRGDLRLMLGDGRIGAQTCRAAIADVKAELQYLEQPDVILRGPGGPQAEAKVAHLLEQRRGLRGQLIANQMPADFYCDEVADISAALMNLGWSQ